MLKLLRSICREESGATAIEMSIIVALVSVAIISAVNELGSSTSEVLQNVASKIAAQSKSGDPPPPDCDDDDDDDCDDDD